MGHDKDHRLDCTLSHTSCEDSENFDATTEQHGLMSKADKIKLALLTSLNKYPQRATMWHDESLVTAGGGNLLVFHDALSDYAFRAFIDTNADGDAFSNSFFLKAGTYSFSATGYSFTSRGKIDWAVDGVNIVTGQDWYSAAGGPNTKKIETGITIATDGYHILTGTINGKNASSSGYAMYLTKFWFFPATDPSRA